MNEKLLQLLYQFCSTLQSLVNIRVLHLPYEFFRCQKETAAVEFHTFLLEISSFFVCLLLFFLQAIELEKKDLYQKWNSSLIGMRRRDEAHSAMQKALK